MVADALGTGFRIVPPGGIGRFLSFFERVRRAPCFFPSLLLIILIASMPLRPDPSAAGAVRPAIAEPGDVTVEMTTDPAQIRAGSAAALTFTFRDPDGRPVRDLEIREDHLLHVMIVSEDLGVFAHIHPEDAGEKPPEKDRGARFTVRYTFPRAGRYLISVDYALKGVRYSRQFFLSVSEPHRLDTI